MSDQDEDPLARFGCRTVADGEEGRVGMLRAIEAEYRTIELRKQARLHRIIELWCAGSRLTPEMFNANEARSAGNVLLQAFKTHKVRLYGFVRQLMGTRTFFVVDLDVAKKQDKADQGILKRARRRADELEGKLK